MPTKFFKTDHMRYKPRMFIIVLLISMITFPSMVQPACNSIIWADITEKWQQDAVTATVEQGIMKEYPGGSFRPDQNVTEAEFAEMIIKFTDVAAPVNIKPETHWAQPFYDEMARYEMPLLGYENIFHRERPLTRGLAARIIARIYGYDLNVQDAVDFMYANHLSAGRDGVKDFESYGAFDLLTRVEAAAIFDALDQNKKAVFKGIGSDISGGKIVKSVLYHSPALPVVSWNNEKGRYALFQGQTYIVSMDDITAAEQYGSLFQSTYLIDQEGKKLVWANFDKPAEFTDEAKQGSLFLVNCNYAVAESYQPIKMVNLAECNSNTLRISNSDMYIDESVVKPLQNMLTDIYYDGADKLLLISAYRSHKTQTMLFHNRVDALLPVMGLEDARKQVAMSTAIPGTSEHQIGLALDFSTVNSRTTTQSFAETKEGQWLGNNSWKYGFTIRYTADKSYITGIISEPWHLRYLGSPHAEIIYRSDMCLEEYLDYICREKTLYFTDYLGCLYGIYYFDSVHSEDLLNFIYLSNNISAVSGDGKGGVIVTTNQWD